MAGSSSANANLATRIFVNLTHDSTEPTAAPSTLAPSASPTTLLPRCLTLGKKPDWRWKMAVQFLQKSTFMCSEFEATRDESEEHEWSEEGRH